MEATLSNIQPFAKHDKTGIVARFRELGLRPYVVSKGSKVHFTTTSEISQSSMEATLSNIQPFAKRTILFVDTLRDKTGIVECFRELG
jgi:hypothetical protein